MYKKNKIMMMLVLIGGVNWGLIGLFDFNLVEYINKTIFSNNNYLQKIIYLLVGLSALMLYKRDVLLPFLGKAVYPCGSLKEKVPDNTNKTIDVKVKPNSNVIYWAANENNKNIDNPWDAYGKYENSGVVKSNEKGIAKLKFKFPTRYSVPRKGLLLPHVHYRVCNNNGMLSRVETVNLL